MLSKELKYGIAVIGIAISTSIVFALNVETRELPTSDLLCVPEETLNLSLLEKPSSVITEEIDQDTYHIETIETEEITETLETVETEEAFETEETEETETSLAETSDVETIVVEPDLEQETSGYSISYVDEAFDRHLMKTMEDFDVNLDPSYVYATIFCESTFRTAVVSSAGAVGYMQIMPFTRDYLHPMITDEYVQYSNLSKDLCDSYTNVIYGLYLFS